MASRATCLVKGDPAKWLADQLGISIDDAREAIDAVYEMMHDTLCIYAATICSGVGYGSSEIGYTDLIVIAAAAKYCDK